MKSKRIAIGMATFSVLAIIGFGVALPAPSAEAKTMSGFHFYEYTYYTDASRTVVAGVARQGCYLGDPGASQWGSVTPYVSESLIGWCNPDGTAIIY